MCCPLLCRSEVVLSHWCWILLLMEWESAVNSSPCSGRHGGMWARASYVVLTLGTWSQALLLLYKLQDQWWGEIAIFGAPVTNEGHKKGEGHQGLPFPWKHQPCQQPEQHGAVRWKKPLADHDPPPFSSKTVHSSLDSPMERRSSRADSCNVYYTSSTAFEVSIIPFFLPLRKHWAQNC